MIDARTARANVSDYENLIEKKILDQINELLEIMSKSIEFQSKNGFTSLTFFPYDKSRFSTVHALELAQEVFTKRFESAGYIVLENQYEKNILKIKW